MPMMSSLLTFYLKASHYCTFSDCILSNN
jgi:parallel beta-helix repeat protein